MELDDYRRWRDPLLITDVSRQQQEQQQLQLPTSNLRDCLNSSSDQSNLSPFMDNTPDQSKLGFSAASPDLVVCADSPTYVPTPSYEYSPECLRNEPQNERTTSFVVSLEEGINGLISSSGKFSTKWESFKEDAQAEDSFELAAPPTEPLDSGESVPIISINCGCEDKETIIGGVTYLQDSSFVGGDVIITDVGIGDGEAALLYQTARFGDFSYHLRFLEPGHYTVDLHFAEIVFTDGPPEMRVFDVYIQGKKVVSRLDIYARVGANRPLVVAGIKSLVAGNEGLSIRLGGLIGNPIISGLSVRKDPSKSTDVAELSKLLGNLKLMDTESTKEPTLTKLASDDVAMEDMNNDSKGVGDFENLQREYEIQSRELAEARRAIEELRRDNQIKSKECQEACGSLQELQNELMRKSMHVGSLAFAIEGQVKEKSKWFSALSDLKRRLKILKVEQLNLSDEATKYKLCASDMDELRSKIQSAMYQQVQFYKELEAKFIEGEKERRDLYNKVLELRGNIRVFCRCRPLNENEIAGGASSVIDFDSAKDGELTVRSNGWAKKTFKFDAVFSPQSIQADVFEETAPFASSVLDGYNACIFAYGQTGTGKTFTMEGTEEARGVNYRTLEKLFHIIEERRQLFRYEISVSVLEVYNEQIRDLLAPIPQPGAASKKLEVRQDVEGMHHIPGLIDTQVNNINEVWGVLRTGSNARATGSTNANEHSSRSHCIHCVMVKGENLLNGECIKSKLWLVDLAGSERIAKTEVQGERLKEAQNINRSLSALGDVISSLATKNSHIPFRNSKLTHLLQDSLGGDSKTLMFVQISPSENDLSETLCSLNFASRVKGIELGPAKKQFDSSEFLRYKQMVEKTKQETKTKDIQIKRMEDTIDNLEMKVKDKDLKNKSLQDKVKELEAQLLIERKLARQHVDTKIAEQQQQTRQVLEEQINQPTRPPLVAKPLGSLRNTNDCSNNLKTLSCLPTKNNNAYYKPQSSFPPEHSFSILGSDFTEKENTPVAVEHLLQPNRTGRVSLGPMSKRAAPASASRRNSLIPLPSALTVAQVTPLKPLPPFQEEDELEKGNGFDSNCLVEPSSCSPKGKSGVKTLNSILKKSLSKKMKSSPLQQHLRKGGLTLGTEKVRVSFASRAKILGHRTTVRGHGSRRVVGTEVHPKHKEKERGWNI